MKDTTVADPSDQIQSSKIPVEQRKSLISDVNTSFAQTNLFLYKNPKELPEDSNFHIVTYFFFQFGGDLIMKVVFASFLLHMCIKGKLKLTPLAALMTSYHIWKISVNLFYLFYYGNKIPEFRKTYYFEIILSIGYFSVFLALFLYSEAAISESSLSLFVIPHVVLMLVRLTVGEAIGTPFLPFSVFCFFESLQILFITLKFASPEEYPRWVFVLLFFYIICITLLVVSVLLILGTILLGVVLLFKRDWLEFVEPIFLVLVAGLIFYVIWTGMAYYLLLIGFHEFVEPNGPPIRGITNTELGNLLYASVLTITGGIITLAILIIFFIYVRENWVRFFNSAQPKIFSLYWFTQGLKLGFGKISDEHFKQERDAAYVKPEGKCLICYDKDADIMIYPCGHSKICKRCITDFMKESNKCPMCRELIEKVYLIYFDEEKNDYLAKGFIVADNHV